MIDNNLLWEYVDNIPWDKNPAFAFNGDTERYIKAFNSVVDVIPVGDMKISFDEDVWDFSKYYKETVSKDYKLIFSGLPNDIKNHCKFFVLYKIMKRRKLPTIYKRLTDFKRIYLSIVEKTTHKSIYVITTKDIKEEVIRRNVSSSTAHSLYEGVYQVYEFISKNYKLSLSVDIKEIKKLGVKESKLEKKEQEENKFPNIPEKYFSKILNKSLSVMRNKHADFSERMTAGLIVLLSQIGLRIGDLLCLKTDALFERKLAKSGHVTHYIHYTEKKPSKPNAPLLEVDIYSSPLATEAFQTMVKLRKTCEFSKTNDYLYVLPSTNGSKDEYPINKNRFSLRYKKFMEENLPKEIKIPWDGIEPSVINYYSKTRRTTVYIPQTPQYRVHLCTTLYEKGIPLVYIQRYMGHLSEYMKGYYVRPKDTYQENISYSEKVIKEIVEENITPLGGSLIGDKIRKNIQEFIEKNNFNIKTDIDDIMKTLGNKVIIRGKTGGVCIKTSLMPCSKDARTNEMMCAYNLCPNLFHFYYMIDVSYLNFKTLQSTYQALKDNGKVKESQKELNKLKDLLRRRLIPELDELDKELSIKGFDTIVSQHPSIVDIIENKDDIRKEIKLWMNKK